MTRGTRDDVVTERFRDVVTEFLCNPRGRWLDTPSDDESFRQVIPAVNRLGLSLRIKSNLTPYQGLYCPALRQIYINEMSRAGAILLHELAHSVLHTRRTLRPARYETRDSLLAALYLAELEAEAVSIVCCKVLDIPIGCGIYYLQQTGQSARQLQRQRHRIVYAARVILAAIKGGNR